MWKFFSGEPDQFKSLLKSWSREFNDRDEEQAFQIWELAGRQKFLNKVVLAGILFNFIYLFSEFLTFGSTGQFYSLLMIRVFMGASAGIGWYVLRVARVPGQLDLIISFAQSGFVGGLALLLIVLGGENVDASGLLLTTVAFYLFFHVRLNYAAVMGVLSTLLYLLVMVYFIEGFTGKFDVLVTSFVITHFFCILALRDMNTKKRREFFEASREKKLIHDLELEVARRKKEEKKYKKAAAIDYLTGLYNRREAVDRFEKELSRMKRYSHTLSIVLLDVDNYKMINDKYGHQWGDQALVFLARVLDKNKRKSDHLARVGGEEFLLILPETDLKQAAEFSEKLRVSIMKESKYFGIPFTASFGVIECEPGVDLDEHLARVDRHLYRAKDEGRNRVVSG